MELFWELASTIALSLLLPFIFIKILSVPPNSKASQQVSVVNPDQDHHHDHDHGVKPDSHRWETEEFLGIVQKFDEIRNESVLDKPVVPEIVDLSIIGSHKILSSGEEIDENRVYDEIEVPNSAENPVQEEIKINEAEAELNMITKGKSRAREVEEVEISRHDEKCNEIDEAGESRARKAEEVEISRCNEIDEETCENKGLLDEEDWEGIERTELEKRFGSAVVFVDADAVAASLSNDVKMKLYGYYRIATQGPCKEPQPMPLKFSARAKWNAWQQLGIMSPEMAMEQYISLLSENIPDWVADCPCENAKSASADIHAFTKLTS